LSYTRRVVVISPYVPVGLLGFLVVACVLAFRRRRRRRVPAAALTPALYGQ